MKKYTEEEIKEHLRAIETAMRTGSAEHVEILSSATERWESFGSVIASFCLARTKPAPKIVPFDVTDAPVNVVIRSLIHAENNARSVVVCVGSVGIRYQNTNGFSVPATYEESATRFEFTRDGVTWQPYGRKEG